MKIRISKPCREGRRTIVDCILGKCGTFDAEEVVLLNRGLKIQYVKTKKFAHPLGGWCVYRDKYDDNIIHSLENFVGKKGFIFTASASKSLYFMPFVTKERKWKKIK